MNSHPPQPPTLLPTPTPVHLHLSMNTHPCVAICIYNRGPVFTDDQLLSGHPLDGSGLFSLWVNKYHSIVAAWS